MSDQPDPTTDIVIEAFSRRYLDAYRRVERIEGGFVNDPRDRGGATKYGVSLRFLVGEGKIDLDADGIADFDLDMDGDIDVADIKALTPGDARYLFHRCFWQRMECQTFPAPLGEAMFDQGVNGGITAARKLLQRAIIRGSGSNSLVIDGRVGPLTRAALTKAIVLRGMGSVVAAYRIAAAERYRAIVAADASQARFLNGWLRRASELGAA